MSSELLLQTNVQRVKQRQTNVQAVKQSQATVQRVKHAFRGGANQAVIVNENVKGKEKKKGIDNECGHAQHQYMS